MDFTLRFLIFLFILSNIVLFGYAYIKTSGYSVFETLTGEVIRVIDGDTIEVNISGDIQKIRFLGINCPESKEEGFNEAKEYTEQYTRREIEIEYTEKDKYGRILAYVFYNNINLNKDLVSKGLCHTYYYEEDLYSRELRDKEREARNNKLGIWELSEDICFKCIKLKELNKQEEYFILNNECEIECNLNGWYVKDEATHFFEININLKSGEEYKQESESVWNNAGDKFFLRDFEGGLVVFYQY